MSTHIEKDDAQKGASEGTAQNPTDAPQEKAAKVPKPETIPKTIRLWKHAFDALKGLMGQYEKNMVDMASIAIIAYAKKAAAAAIVKYRTLEDKALFALQASATDIKAGLSNLHNDLYVARKSHRDPAAAKALYEGISGRYEKTIGHADDTLDLIKKELRLTEILSDADHEFLPEIIEKLETQQPANQRERRKRDFELKIFKSLLPP